MKLLKHAAMIIPASIVLIALKIIYHGRCWLMKELTMKNDLYYNQYMKGVINTAWTR